ncbi:MAG: hypothetical protein ACKVVT_12775 [Dehalococcoidia bacterium]
MLWPPVGVRPYLTVIAIFVSAVAVACSGSSSTERRPVVGEPEGAAFAGTPDTLRSLVATADFIGTVRPVARLEDYWPTTGPQAMGAARFELEVVTVEKGRLRPGQRIVAHAQGGRVVAVAAAHGSRKPNPGDETVDLEPATRPYYRVGREEFVCLARIDSEDAGVIYFDLLLGSRYEVVDGSFRAIGTPDWLRAEVAAMSERPFWVDLEKPVPDVLKDVRGTIARKDPKPTEEP